MPQFLSSILQIISCEMGRWLWKALQSFFRWGLGSMPVSLPVPAGSCLSSMCARRLWWPQPRVAHPLLRTQKNKTSKKESNLFAWIEAKVDESKRIFGFEEALPSSFGQVTFNSVGPIGKERKEGIYSSVELFSVPSGFGAGKRCVK